MKAGWQAKSLADVLLKTETVNPNLQPEFDFEYIDVSSVSNQTFQIEETQNLKGKDAPSRARKLVKTNDILFATIRPTLQRIAIVPSKFNNQVCSTGYFVLRPNQSIHYKYLYYYLFADGFMGQMEALQKGASYPAVTDNEVKSQSISFPIIPEQQRIVAILDQALEGIAKVRANAEINLQNARALFESHLQSVFTQRGEGWEVKALGDVLQKTETVDPSRKPNIEFIYLDVSSVNKDTKEIESVTVMLGKDAPSRARKLIRTNDVIFATVRPTHSRVALIPEEYNEQVCSTGYFVLRAKEFLNNNLVLYFLLTPDFNKQMEKLQKGASYPAVTDSEVKSIMIHYPKSAVEQNTLVVKFNLLREETQRLEALYQRKITLLDELKKSFLQQAFAGEL